MAKLESKHIKNEVKIRLDSDAAHAQAKGTVSAPLGSPDNPSSQVFTLANCITFCRFILTLIFLHLFANHINRPLSLTLYAVAAITDFLDGQIARRTQTVSWTGKLMDPIMDRVLLFTGVLGLIVTGELPLWVACFVIGRDIYLALGSIILQRYRKRPVDVVYVGKAATALLMFGFTDLLLGVPQLPALHLFQVAWLPGLNGSSSALGIYLVYAGVICSFITAVVYTQKAITIYRQAKAFGGRLDD